MAKKRQPSAEEMLRWLVKHQASVRNYLGDWWVAGRCNGYGEHPMLSPRMRSSWRAAIRAAMKADRTAGR